MDNKPMVNIADVRRVHGLANPTVATATAAAMGVLTPMPHSRYSGAVGGGVADRAAGQYAGAQQHFDLDVYVGGRDHGASAGQFTEMIP